MTQGLPRLAGVACGLSMAEAVISSFSVIERLAACHRPRGAGKSRATIGSLETAMKRECGAGQDMLPPIRSCPRNCER